MTPPKPSDLAHQRLKSAKHDPLERSLNEVELLMNHFEDAGYSTLEAIQLTDITLSNVIEEGL